MMSPYLQSAPAKKFRLRWYSVAMGLVSFVLSSWWVDRHRSLDLRATADRVEIDKTHHIMTLYANGVPLKSYLVALGRGGLHPKQQAGDNRVPEGTYRIVGRNAHSAFYRALRIGYPTLDQIHAAHARGVEPGGDILIHGLRNGLGWLGPVQHYVDWTRGCIALSDHEMDEIWNAVPDGTLVDIRR